MKYFLLLFLLAIASPQISSAHPGDVDPYGYHYCWLGYYECVQYGVQYGVKHYHGSNYINSTPMTNEQLEEFFKDNDEYEKIKNGFRIYGSTYCDDGADKVEDECVKIKIELEKNTSVSLSNPVYNERLRFEEQFKKGNFSAYEDFTEKELEKYADLIEKYINVPKEEPIVVPVPVIQEIPVATPPPPPTTYEPTQTLRTYTESEETPVITQTEATTTATTTEDTLISVSQEELDRIVQEKIDEVLESKTEEPEVSEPTKPSFFKRIVDFFKGWF